MAHLVWDWNGTLLDDLTLVVEATNVSLRTVGGPVVTADEHRRTFRRPVSAYYEFVLGRELEEGEFDVLDHLFHDAYLAGLSEISLAVDARLAIDAWSGSQSVLSMYRHHELVPAVAARGLNPYLSRVDGLRDKAAGGPKAPHLQAHLGALDLLGAECVLIGDSVDDADAAADVGAVAILYAGGFTDEDRLRATGRPVAHSLVEAVELAVAAVALAA